MFLIAIGSTLLIFGFSLIYLTRMFPVLQIIYMDIIGAVIVAAAWIITIYRIYVTKAQYQVDRLPKWKHLINYIRRDNETIPLLGDRAYPGESFIDVPDLGLIEFLGKDCYYQWGDKKYLWGLENINYSPDVRYSNLCHVLWELGFRNSDDVSRVLKGQDLFLMGKVYQNMLRYDQNHGAGKLVHDMENYQGKIVDFTPQKSTTDIIHEKIDAILKKR